MKLEGKNALITGAAVGIGKAIAQEFAREGANVAVIDIQDEKGKAVVEEIAQLGVKSLYLHCNVTDPQAVSSAFESARGQFGGLDILVNNAAIIHCAKIVDVELEDWHRIIDVNLNGYFYFCRLMARHLVDAKKKGKIINISSIHGRISEPNCGPYTAAKGGVEGFTRTLASELAPYKINVNAIAPGATYTELTTPMYTEKVVKALHQWIPWSEIAQPEFIARPAVFLASDDAYYITGETLAVDGGVTMDIRFPGVEYWEE